MLCRQAGESSPESDAALNVRTESVEHPEWFVSYHYPAGVPNEDKPRPAYTHVGVPHHGAVEEMYWQNVRQQAAYKEAFELADVPADGPPVMVESHPGTSLKRMVPYACQRTYLWRCGPSCLMCGQPFLL